MTTNETTVVKTRRSSKGKDGKRMDTSSESGTVHSESTESLHLTISLEDSRDKTRINQKHVIKSSFERRGWHKFHRKCYPCPEITNSPWRHPNIKWICGAFQRARRSFKSECLMYYRNCQDGTMFRKIHDHQCENDSEHLARHGQHFFYDYSAALSGDKTGSDSDKDSSFESSLFVESSNKKRS